MWNVLWLPYSLSGYYTTLSLRVCVDSVLKPERWDRVVVQEECVGVVRVETFEQSSTSNFSLILLCVAVGDCSIVLSLTKFGIEDVL